MTNETRGFAGRASPGRTKKGRVRQFFIVCFVLLFAFCAAQTFPVTATDRYGDVTLERRPERVVVLTDELAEIAVALGIKPVGVSSTRFKFSVGDKAVGAGHLAPALDGATFVGGSEPSLEAITALEPDLIVAYADNEALRGQLQAVAPTLTFSLDRPRDWQGVMRTLARATGRTGVADAYLARFDEQVTTLRRGVGAVAAAHPDVNVVYPQYRGGAENFVFGETFGLAGNVAALGFNVVVPEGVELTPEGYGTLSSEAFRLLDADTVLSVGVGERENNAANRLLDAATTNLAYVDIGLGRPPQGPMSDLFYMERFADAVQALY